MQPNVLDMDTGLAHILKGSLSVMRKQHAVAPDVFSLFLLYLMKTIYFTLHIMFPYHNFDTIFMMKCL